MTYRAFTKGQILASHHGKKPYRCMQKNGNYCRFDFDRQAAATAAVLLGRQDPSTFIKANNMEELPYYSGMFMSLAYYSGNLPMLLDSSIVEPSESTHHGWYAYKDSEGKIWRSQVWGAHSTAIDSGGIFVNPGNVSLTTAHTELLSNIAGGRLVNLLVG